MKIDTQNNFTEVPWVSLRGICKSFSGVMANDHIYLDIYRSEIHALLGENGAGKSTLMKVLYGFYKLDHGSIFIDGQEIVINNPADARRLNIGMVFQVLNLIPAMSVLENIALFLKDLPEVFDPQKVRRKIVEYSGQYGLEIQPDKLVSQLSIGEQQKVEILKLLLSEAKVLILDEPTRVLAPHEIDALFTVVRKLKENGYAIVLITHKLKEVMKCADRITVLRGGKVGGNLLRQDATESVLVRMMFEKQIITQVKKKTVSSSTEAILELDSLCTRGERSTLALNDINLKVHRGEIVGVAGVSGNGQKELCDVILGLNKISSGEKRIKGKNFSKESTGMMRNYGLGFIPENPLTMATVPYMSVLENMAITKAKFYSKFGGLGINWKMVQQDTRGSLNKFGFTFSYYVPAKSLSGGNLQRFVIAREMSAKPELIVASYLTRGLDVQSAMIARQELLNASEAGAAVLLISEDLEELFTLSDRLVILYEGQIVGEFKPEEIDFYTIGHLMTGSKENNDD